MARIKNTIVYPFDTLISLDDHVIGTDKDTNGKTKNYKVGALINLFQEIVGVSTLAYTFSDGSEDGEGNIFSHTDAGYFGTDNNQTSYATITYFRFNHINAYGVNLEEYFATLIANPNSLTLKIGKPGNPNNFAYYKVISGLQSDTHSTIGVELIDQASIGSLEHLKSYSVYLDASGGTGGNVDQNNILRVIDLGQHKVALDNTIVFNDAIEELNQRGFTLGEFDTLLVKQIKGNIPKETDPVNETCKRFEITYDNDLTTSTLIYIIDCEGEPRYIRASYDGEFPAYFYAQSVTNVEGTATVTDLSIQDPPEEEDYTALKFRFVEKGEGSYGYAYNNLVEPKDFELIYDSNGINRSSVDNELIQLGDISTYGDIISFLNNQSNPQSISILENKVYLFEAVIDGVNYLYLYDGPKPSTIGYNDTLANAVDFILIEQDGQTVGGNIPTQTGQLQNNGEGNDRFVEEQELGSAAYQESNSFATAAQGSKADSALQVETDPTVPSHVKGITQTNISNWVTAFNKNLVSGSITGDANKTLTLTHRDGNSLIIPFQDLSGNAADGVVNTLDFNLLGNGVLRATTTEGDIVSVSLDGRYSLLGHQHTKADITDFNDTDYATAAQGTKADSALQPGDINVYQKLNFSDPTETDGTIKMNNTQLNDYSSEITSLATITLVNVVDGGNAYFIHNASSKPNFNLAITALNESEYLPNENNKIYVDNTADGLEWFVVPETN